MRSSVIIRAGLFSMTARTVPIGCSTRRGFQAVARSLRRRSIAALSSMLLTMRPRNSQAWDTERCAQLVLLTSLPPYGTSAILISCNKLDKLSFWRNDSTLVCVAHRSATELTKGGARYRARIDCYDTRAAVICSSISSNIFAAAGRRSK